MKKLYLLSGMIFLGSVFAALNAMESRPELSLSQGAGWGGAPSSLEIYAKMDKCVANGKDANWNCILNLLNIYLDDVNEYRALDGTPLIFIAALNQKYSILKELLEKYDADPNIAEPNKGYTALMVMCRYGEVPIVQLLLEHGADPLQKDKSGKNSFDHARGKANIVSILQSNARSEAFKKLDTLFFKGSGINWDAIFAILDTMDKDKINAYQVPKTGGSLLHLALLSGAGRKDISIVDALLELYKMNPNIKDQNEVTPLMLASKYGHMALVELLLKYGAAPYIKDNQGKNSFDYTDVDSIYRKLEMATW